MLSSLSYAILALLATMRLRPVDRRSAEAIAIAVFAVMAIVLGLVIYGAVALTRDVSRWLRRGSAPASPVR